MLQHVVLCRSSVVRSAPDCVCHTVRRTISEQVPDAEFGLGVLNLRFCAVSAAERTLGTVPHVTQGSAFKNNTICPE